MVAFELAPERSAAQIMGHAFSGQEPASKVKINDLGAQSLGNTGLHLSQRSGQLMRSSIHAGDPQLKHLLTSQHPEAIGPSSESFSASRTGHPATKVGLLVKAKRSASTSALGSDRNDVSVPFLPLMLRTSVSTLPRLRCNAAPGASGH